MYLIFSCLNQLNLCNVYLNEGLRYMLLMRIYDTWIEIWTCDAWFTLVHKNDLCRCECWTWIDVMIIWYHCELLSGDTWWNFNCHPYNCLPNVDKYWGESNPKVGIPTNQMNTWWGLPQIKWLHGGNSHNSNKYMVGTPTNLIEYMVGNLTSFYE